jgi:hypothetical protein
MAWLCARYGTFCELAGTDPFDHEANATNAWLATQGLPLLPPVGSVSQWSALVAGAPPPRAEVHLSAKAILVRRGARLLKLVSGDQASGDQKIASSWGCVRSRAHSHPPRAALRRCTRGGLVSSTLTARERAAGGRRRLASRSR